MLSPNGLLYRASLLIFALAIACAVCPAANANGFEPLFQGLALAPHRYWHPPVIHFPVVFLILESLLLCGYLFARKQSLATASRWSLWLATLSIITAIISGLHDAGVDIDVANPITAGFADRIKNFGNFQEAISVHVFYVLCLVAITALRLCWRFYLDKTNKFKGQRLPFAIASLVGLWILFAAAQAGGTMSHP